jgi:4-hydroxyphenylpyruvate dioxygenase-like putative hemolysin
VEDPDTVACHAAALAASEGLVVSTSDENAVEVRIPDTLNQLGLRFVRSELGYETGLPSGVPVNFDGFQPIPRHASGEQIPGGIMSIDHVAINVLDVDATLDKLEKVVPWSQVRTFDEHRLARPLRAVTIGSPTSEGLLTVVQPTAQHSVFQQALQANGGVSVHHVALRCSDIISFADHMAAQGRWAVMPPPDRAYYDMVRPMALKFVDEADFEKLATHGMLIDCSGDCAIVQVFLPYLGDVPNVFFELIGRLPPRHQDSSRMAAPGCGGFGDANVTRLYDCLVSAVDQPPVEWARGAVPTTPRARRSLPAQRPAGRRAAAARAAGRPRGGAARAQAA